MRRHLAKRGAPYTYRVVVADWRVGVIPAVLAAVVIYRHDASSAGWYVVLFSGLLYTGLGAIIGRLSARVTWRAIVGCMTLTGIGANVAFHAGLIGVPALHMHIFLLCFNTVILPTLNPVVTVVMGESKLSAKQRGSEPSASKSASSGGASVAAGFKSSRRLRSLVSKCLIGSAVCIGAGTPIVAFLWPPKTLEAAMVLVGVNIAVAMAGAASYWIRIAAEIRRPTGNELQEAMSPIIYLRPFSADERLAGAENHVVGFLVGAAGYFGNLNHVEMSVVETLTRVAPVVALAKPGEPQSIPGALRLSVADAEWKQAVTALIERSAYAVIQVGTTPGVTWELKRTLQLVPIDRVVFWLPKPFDQASQQVYEALRRMIRHDASLPPWRLGMVIVSFLPDGTPEVHQLHKVAKYAGEGRSLAAVLSRCFNVPLPSNTSKLGGICMGAFAVVEMCLHVT